MKIKQDILRCPYCGEKMKNYIPNKGRFRGQIQKYSWFCDCEKYPKNLIMCVG